jgi:hypothetical protein
MACAAGPNSDVNKLMTKLIPVNPIPIVTPDLKDFERPAPIINPNTKMIIGNITAAPKLNIQFNAAILFPPLYFYI